MHHLVVPVRVPEHLAGARVAHDRAGGGPRVEAAVHAALEDEAALEGHPDDLAAARLEAHHVEAAEPRERGVERDPAGVRGHDGGGLQDERALVVAQGAEGGQPRGELAGLREGAELDVPEQRVLRGGDVVQVRERERAQVRGGHRQDLDGGVERARGESARAEGRPQHERPRHPRERRVHAQGRGRELGGRERAEDQVRCEHERGGVRADQDDDEALGVAGHLRFF